MTPPLPTPSADSLKKKLTREQLLELRKNIDTALDSPARPTTDNSTHVGTRVPVEQKRCLDLLALANGRKRADEVRAALRSYLEHNRSKINAGP